MRYRRPAGQPLGPLPGDPEDRHDSPGQQGVSRERLLAGLFDAVCENVLGLLRPRLAPHRVLLIGGVALSPRVRHRVSRYLAAHSMELLPNGDDETVFLEALGCAHFAAGTAAGRAPPPLAQLLRRDAAPGLEHLPGLRHHLEGVHRLPTVSRHPLRGDEPCVLGLDIGSTGSKAVGVEIESRQPVWEAYVPTRGDPVAATRCSCGASSRARSGAARYTL